MARPRFVTLGALVALLGCTGVSAANLVTAQQGGVARWEGLAAKDCGIYGKRYAAVGGTCYFPVDIHTAVGAHEIALWDKDGHQHLGTLQVKEEKFPDVDIELPPTLDKFIDVSPADNTRAAAESAAVAKVLNGSDPVPHFTLPLHKPAAALPKSENDFGSTRVFNKKVRSLHSGRDFPVGAGNAVVAVADGTVVLAADHFFTGNAVYVDHGGGLVSMSFHLQSIAVKVGDKVKRGQTLGKIGGTGRSTGPHLHIGLRYVGKRIDPLPLFDPPSKLPSVSDTSAEAAAKIQRAESKEPKESDPPPDNG